MTIKLLGAITALSLSLGGCDSVGGQERGTSARVVGLKLDPSKQDQPVRKAFPTASEVRLFVEKGYDGTGKPMLTKSSGLRLSSAQRAEFESLLFVHRISPDESFAACFIPHHFFRYYDQAGKQLGEIAVCFCCAGVRSSGESNIRLGSVNDLRADFGKLERFVGSLGEPTDVGCDDSA